MKGKKSTDTVKNLRIQEKDIKCCREKVANLVRAQSGVAQTLN